MKQRYIPRETIALSDEDSRDILAYFNKLAKVPYDAKLFYNYPCDNLQQVERVIIALKDNRYWAMTLQQLIGMGYR